MFERFTERARKVVVLAQEEAARLRHGYVGTEHLLLGLIREEEGVAAQSRTSTWQDEIRAGGLRRAGGRSSGGGDG